MTRWSWCSRQWSRREIRISKAIAVGGPFAQGLVALGIHRELYGERDGRGTTAPLDSISGFIL
jgi:hypothetical protein